ncbi:metallophosphoesterase family protein [Clostridium nigeriense]|uniref:metallophosphoesterase family protein n=1 Tax=Clostridium nigeriense TaxID=1805470 RepID=UPI003D34C41A
MDNLKWIQLSDIHFQYDNCDSQWLRDMLPEYLREEKVKCDFMVITGDLLYKGQGNYKDVAEYIDTIASIVEVDKENIFIIPGNHDLKRNSVRSLMIDGIISSGNIKEKVDSLPDDAIRILINDQKEFWDFHNEYLDRDDKYENLHFINERDDFNIINLNTCLICGSEKEEESLSVNTKKLIRELRKIKGSNKVNIAIGHHGLECFNDKEQETLVYLFDDYDIDLYLCGHMHKSNINFYGQGKRDIRSIVCGANMKDSFADASIVIGNIDFILSTCSIEYHKWSDGINSWAKDNEIHRKINREDQVNFELERLKKIKDDSGEVTDIDEEIERLIQPKVKIEKFQKFLLDFCTQIQEYEFKEENLDIKKDVENKFENMKCCTTLVTDFNSLAEYFPLMDKILLDTSYLPFDRKNVIPGKIKTTYYKVLDKNQSGTGIMSDMIEILVAEYSSKVDISEDELSEYFKIIICWSINACSIYNESK